VGGFHRSALDLHLYINESGKGIVVLVVYVYDLIMTRSDETVIIEVKKDL